MKTFTLPLKLESLANKREHWTQKAARAKTQRRHAKFFCPNFELPCVVTITRVAPRQFDDDNLAISAKHVRDGIADKLGIDDRDKRVTWLYDQVRGRPKTYEVRVQLISEAEFWETNERLRTKAINLLSGVSSLMRGA